MGTLASLIVLASLAAGHHGPDLPARQIEVRLRDGCVYRNARIEHATERKFKFRVGTPACYMIVSIGWDQLQAVRLEARQLRGKQLAAWRSELIRSVGRSGGAKREPPVEAVKLAEPQRRQPLVEPPAPPPAGRPPRATRSDPLPPPAHRRVSALYVDATAANWDADPEWDGLELAIRPVDRFGRLQPVRGTVTVVLLAVANQFRWRSRPAGRPQLRQIGRWSRSLRPEQFRFGPARLLLPFGPNRPEPSEAPWHPNWSIGAYGRVEVQLDVPGQGSFRAVTDYPVRIRRFSPIGDWLFLSSGSRYR